MRQAEIVRNHRQSPERVRDKDLRSTCGHILFPALRDYRTPAYAVLGRRNVMRFLAMALDYDGTIAQTTC